MNKSKTKVIAHCIKKHLTSRGTKFKGVRKQPETIKGLDIGKPETIIMC